MTNVKDRAYNLMYLAEQKFGHCSAAHVVAWTVFSDACAALAGEASPAAYTNAGDMTKALDVVERACGKRGRLNAAVRELANRPRSMGSMVEARE